MANNEIKLTKMYLKQWVVNSLEAVESKINSKYKPQSDALDEQIEVAFNKHSFGVLASEITNALTKYARGMEVLLGESHDLDDVLDYGDFRRTVNQALHGNFSVDFKDFAIELVCPEILSEKEKIDSEWDSKIEEAQEASDKLIAIINKAKKPQDALDSLLAMGFEVPLSNPENAIQAVGDFKKFKDMLYGEV